MPASTRWIETSTRATPSRKPPELRLIPNSKAPGVSDDCPTNTRASRVHEAHEITITNHEFTMLPKSADLRIGDIPRRAHPSRDLSATSQAAPRYVSPRQTRAARTMCDSVGVVACSRGSEARQPPLAREKPSFSRKLPKKNYPVKLP